MVCDVSFFKVKLVQERLPIKQMIKWLRSNFKESWPTSKETAGEPDRDPACDEVKHRMLPPVPALGLGSYLLNWSKGTSSRIGPSLLDKASSDFPS